jgi:hypothetical protein
MRWQKHVHSEMCRVSEATVVYLTWYEAEVHVGIFTYDERSTYTEAITRRLHDADSQVFARGDDDQATRAEIEEWCSDILEARVLGTAAICDAAEENSRRAIADSDLA